MRITQLILEKFKKVDKVDISLLGLNVLVGGNNAGKSSVLQGIHFSVIAAIASREAGRDTFTQDSLLYCPARDFESLRHGNGYTNQTHFGHLRLSAITEEEAKAQQYEVRIYRGRNEGNVGCQRSGAVRLGALVSSREQLFSIYVPGLAGVSQFEQHRSESVVRRGVASGDANLYLRNVMLLIQEKGKLGILAQRMKICSQSLKSGFLTTLSMTFTLMSMFRQQVRLVAVAPLSLLAQECCKHYKFFRM